MDITRRYRFEEVNNRAKSNTEKYKECLNNPNESNKGYVIGMYLRFLEEYSNILETKDLPLEDQKLLENSFDAAYRRLRLMLDELGWA